MREEGEAIGTPMDRSSFSIQLEDYKKLNQLIKEEVETKLNEVREEPYSSPQTEKLNAALAKAQAEFMSAIFNRTNPYLDQQYLDLEGLIRASRKALTKNEIAVIFQLRTPASGATILHTKLLHSSGQWMEGRARILPVRNDVAAFESALNAQKRFSYMAMLAIVPTDDPGDDDGERAMIDANKFIANGPSEKNNPKKQSIKVIAQHQLTELERELKDFPELAENLLERLRIQSLADLPESQYASTMTRILRIKEEINNQNGDRSGRSSSKF